MSLHLIQVSSLFFSQNKPKITIWYCSLEHIIQGILLQRVPKSTCTLRNVCRLKKYSILFIHWAKIQLPYWWLEPLFTEYLRGASQMGLMVKNPPADAWDAGLIPELGKPPEVGNGNLPQYSCLDYSIDRWAQWAIADGATESWTQLGTDILDHPCLQNLSATVIITGNIMWKHS